MSRSDTLKVLGVCILSFIIGQSTMFAASFDRGVYDKALELYRSGMYDGAQRLFASLDDPLCRDYAALCLVKSGRCECEDAVKAIEGSAPLSPLRSRLWFEYAGYLFARGRYVDAARWYSMVSADRITPEEFNEATFKLGYCEYARGSFKDAARHFKKVVAHRYSAYSASSNFLLGCISYEDSDFEQAAGFFRKAGQDEKFRDICDFYIADCLFLLHDYSGAVEIGENIYVTSSQKRQAYLSKILSESFLVLGQNIKAKEYLQKENAMGPQESLGYEDYFRRASVLYAMGDYSAAIDNFTKMVNPYDSIGQVACYELGHSYIKVGNKVSAMASFKQAASMDYDLSIMEDASFNYAKLAFELNNDDVPFREYAFSFSSAGKRDEVYRYLALSALKSGDFTEAVRCYDEIETLCQDDQLNYTKACFQRSRELLSRGAYSDAIKYLKCTSHFLSRHDPLARLSRYWLADTYYRVSDYKESLRLYSDLYYTVSSASKDSCSALLPYNVAYCQYRLGDYASSAKWFDMYLGSGNEIAREDALVRRSDCDFERADYVHAAASYQKALDEFPGNLYAVYYQSVSYSLSGNREGRAESLSAVLSADSSAPYYLDCLNALGYAYADLGRNDEALSVFRNVGGFSSEPAVLAMSCMGLGMVCRNTGDLDAALNHYKRVVSLVRGSSCADDALSALLSINQLRGTPQAYLNYIDSLGLGNTQSPSERRKILFTSAEQLYMSSSYDRAISALQAFLSSYPDGEYLSEVYYYLGDSYRHLGRKESALDYYRKSMDMSDNGSGTYELALMNAASLAYSLQKYDLALEYYQTLSVKSRIASNIPLSQEGIMRSAFQCREYVRTIAACEWIESQAGSSEDLVRESMLLRAKSCMRLSRRDEALSVLKELSLQASTPEGAQAYFMVLQSMFDAAEYDKLDDLVYSFSEKCGNQSYWLARAYILLGDSFLEQGNSTQARVTYESIRDGYQSDEKGDDILEIVNSKLSALQ